MVSLANTFQRCSWPARAPKEKVDSGRPVAMDITLFAAWNFAPKQIIQAPQAISYFILLLGMITRGNVKGYVAKAQRFENRIRNILQTWILAGNLVYQPPFISQIPDFVYLNGSDSSFFLSILNGVSLKTSKYIYQICNMRAIYHRRMVCCPNIKSQPRSQVTPR